MALHEQAPALQVDRIPGEPAHLARAQSGGDGKLDEDPFGGHIQGGGEPADFLGVQDLHKRGDLTRAVAGGRYVALTTAPPSGSVFVLSSKSNLDLLDEIRLDATNDRSPHL